MGAAENGGTNAPTLLPSALENFWVSQVPSTIMAALPDSKSPRLLVLVSTSEFVQPSLFSLDQVNSCAAVAGEVHGTSPLYSFCHSPSRHCPTTIHLMSSPPDT